MGISLEYFTSASRGIPQMLDLSFVIQTNFNPFLRDSCLGQQDVDVHNFVCQVITSAQLDAVSVRWPVLVVNT